MGMQEEGRCTVTGVLLTVRSLLNLAMVMNSRRTPDFVLLDDGLGPDTEQT